MATASNPLLSTKTNPEFLKRAKSLGVNQSVTVSLFFGPPHANGNCACLINLCGNMLVTNKSTKTNFVNHISFNANI
ncbi:hypothetical protein PSTG_02301 [Puccinia striiformis f. sp. tritici PST-78]|uniref:Uncharacterized protein n=1 Tax=Puccinia striiformis f. sp. tritici PST-78 TaxID=1165861 RepID=A0A0L0VZE8_9BASI|nr:hypothetical protein PSTG_02301 [Puccinia striiformis f. sp. tritici PST-78]